MQRVELVELQPLGSIIVQGDLYPALAKSLSVGGGRVDRDRIQRHGRVHPPVSAPKSVGTTRAAGILELVFPTPRAAKIHVDVTVDKVIAIQERRLENGAASIPVIERGYVAVDSVVAVEERDIGVRVRLDSPWQMRAVTPVTE